MEIEKHLEKKSTAKGTLFGKAGAKTLSVESSRQDTAAKWRDNYHKTLDKYV